MTVHIYSYCALKEKTIFVNDRLWYSLNREMREILIYHELGHCLGELLHDDSRIGIMNTNINYFLTRPGVYTNNRNDYLDFMFTENYSISERVQETLQWNTL